MNNIQTLDEILEPGQKELGVSEKKKLFAAIAKNLIENNDTLTIQNFYAPCLAHQISYPEIARFFESWKASQIKLGAIKVIPSIDMDYGQLLKVTHVTYPTNPQN